MKNFFRELQIAGFIIKKNLENAMGLRTAFMLQIFGMFINNFSLVIIWVFFFKVFGTVNNWGIRETIGLQAFLSLVFGLAFSFGNGVRTLALKVHLGGFDTLLTRPRNLYFSIATGSIGISALGDLLFGVVVGIYYAFMAHLSLSQILLGIGMIVPCAVIFLNFSLITSLAAFLLPDAENISKNLFELLISPSLYPSALYTGIMRFIFIFGIPALVVGGLPIEAIRDNSLLIFIGVWLIAIFWTILAEFLLKKLVRRYESGNLIGSTGN